jgi:hypothetical protein
MEEKEIVRVALDNLQSNTTFKGKWKKNALMEVDGILELKIDKKQLNLNAEVKKELRNQQLPTLVMLAQQFKPFIVIAERIFPNIKEELRQTNIAYLEGNGDIFLEYEGIFIWIDTNKPIATTKEKTNRAFTKTGIKVVFHFLLNEELLKLPYREIADITETGLGNVTNVVNGLKEAGFLLIIGRNNYRLNRKKELLEKWVIAYDEKLKPVQELGTFRFLKQEDFYNWKNIKLKEGKTYWGGEPAGDIYTNYLKPGILTLYTTETRTDLIKNYKLIPDLGGNIKVYKKFWNYDEVYDSAVPPLLAYADLISTGDQRCIETAQKIYDELLKDKF